MAAREDNRNNDGRTDRTGATRKREPVGQTWLVNPGTTPMVYDADGRSLAAGERRAVGALDAVGAAAVAGGYLKAEKTPEDDGEVSDQDTPGAPTGD